MCYSYFSTANQKVICEALGYSSQSKAKIILLLLNLCDDTGTTGYGSSFLNLPLLPFFPQSFQCLGNEQSPLDCRLYTLNCHNNYQYSGINCQGTEYILIFKSNIIVLLYR